MSGKNENGSSEYDDSSSRMIPGSVQLDVPGEEGGSNGLADLDPLIDRSLQPNGPIDVAHGADSSGEVDDGAYQEDNGDAESNDAKATEDMFEDASDELTIREALAASESSEDLGATRNMRGASSGDRDNGMQVRQLMDEVENLRAMLEKADSEKTRITVECKEERATIRDEVVKLHQQLKALILPQSVPVGSNEGLTDQLYEKEMRDSELNGQTYDMPLQELINECSQFFKTAVAERSHAEGTMRELHAILFMKDEEIRDLNAKATGLSEKDRNIDLVTNRMIASIAPILNQGDMVYESFTGKISHLEKMSSELIENYEQFISESSELKRKELELGEKLHHLEVENMKLLEQLDCSKEIAGKTNAELEQERTRCANVKEKLTLAVTKGKALVQQRDSLRQSLADKTSELEKCTDELKEKSRALEAAELSNVELVECKNFVSSLQVSLSERDTYIEKSEEILSEITVPEDIQSADMMERLRWLVDEINVLTGVSVEFYKLRDALSLIDLPENVSLADLEFQIQWLGDSLGWSKEELRRVKDETGRMREAADNIIDLLTATLSTEIQEKIYLQKGLEELICEHKEMANKELQISQEKDWIVRMLLEASGSTTDNQGEFYQPPSDMAVLVDGCFQRMKKQSAVSAEISHIDAEAFEIIQGLLYVKDQDLRICELVLEEEMVDRTQLSRLSGELKVASQELLALKDEKSSLMKDLERSEEKTALLREKLSMAVKKGKGLVQERENLKQLLDEKKTEIKKLGLELQQQGSALSDCRDNMQRLSTEVECIPKIENDIAAMKDQRDQLEQLLVESNNMLQKLTDSIDQIVLPVDSVFDEIIEKVRWLSGYVSECQFAKTSAEEELRRVKEEARTLAGQLKEATAVKKSLEDALSVSENSVSQLAEERRELELNKAHLEQQLRTVVEEANSHAEQELKRLNEEAIALAGELTNAKAVIKSQGDALSVSENSNFQLGEERRELESVKKSLEDALSVSENSVSQLAEERRELELNKAHLEQQLRTVVEEANSHAEQELKRLNEEAIALAGELTNAKAVIKSQGDALSVSENSNFQLGEERRELESVKKSLEDALSVSENSVSQLAEERRELELNKAHLEQQLRTVVEEANSHAEKELKRLNEEAIALAGELTNAKAVIKSQEDALSVSENSNFQLEEERRELESVKVNLEQQLQKAMEEGNFDAEQELRKLNEDVTTLDGKLIDANTTIKSLEVALLDSESKASLLAEEIKKLEVEKVDVEQKLLKAIEEASSHAEQELRRLKEEDNTLVNKLVEANSTIKSLEVTLSDSGKQVSQLAKEIRELEVGKADVEQQFHNALEEAAFQSRKLTESYATIKSLEDALAVAESDLSVLRSDKEDAQSGRAAVEIELEKLRDISTQTSKLTEALKTIESLEDALSQVKNNIVLLTEENKDLQVGRANLENELKKLEEESGFHTSKLTDAQKTIESLEVALSNSDNKVSKLEDSLVKAEGSISALVGEKNVTEQKLSALSSQLNVCMEELAETRGSTEIRSQELCGHLSSLQNVMKDEALLSSYKRSFEGKYKSLKDMEQFLKNIMHLLTDSNSSGLMSNYPAVEVNSCWTKLISNVSDSISRSEFDYCEIHVADGDNISSYLTNTVEGFHSRNQILAQMFEDFSTFMDEYIASLLRGLEEIRDEAIHMQKHKESLNQKVKNLEIIRQDQDKTVAILKSDNGMLLSACSNATQELQCVFEMNFPEVDSNPVMEAINQNLLEGSVNCGDATEHWERYDGGQHTELAEKLLGAAKKCRTVIMQFENISNMSVSTIEDLQQKLSDAQKTSERELEERKLNQGRIFKLESEVQALQNTCTELDVKVEDYQVREVKMKDRETELSSLYNTSLMKQKESPFLSASELNMYFDKMNGITIPFPELESGEQDLHNSGHVQKLFYIIDEVPELQHQIKSLSHDKEELQLELSMQVLEIKKLEKQADKTRKDSEQFREDLLEIELGLEKIIQKLGGNDLVGERKSAYAGKLLAVLETLVVSTILESEDSKLKVQELDVKLSGSQKLVDELSTKIRLLEDLTQGRAPPPETVQERSVYEATSRPSGSEISEIEDVGLVGKRTLSPVPSAAHVRTMRKGSNDHLALNIDLETGPLINHEENDEDKGHAFRSLNTSGFIPKPGKMIADRIDGIWVSGSKVLMSRPRARLGIVVYWLLLHMWLLGTLL